MLYAASNGGTEDARYIGLVAAAFGLGLPAFSAQYVALRGFYAFEDTRTPFLLQVVIATVNVGLALLAYAVLPLEAKMIGVAAPTPLTYLLVVRSTAVRRRRRSGRRAGWSGHSSGCWSPGPSPGSPGLGRRPAGRGRRWPTGRPPRRSAGGRRRGAAGDVRAARPAPARARSSPTGRQRAGTSPALTLKTGGRPADPSACPRSPPALPTGATSSSAG